MNHINPLISLIIPCYNVQEYIEDCIESIMKQSYSNFEIIAVDDRSKDNTFTILSKLSSIENRLKVIRNTGTIGGASYARNLGIKASNGDYIAFVDSDDIISNNYLKDFVLQLNEYSFDIVTCHSINFYEKPNINNIQLHTLNPIQCHTINDILENFDKMGSVAYCLWGKIIRTEIIKKNNIIMDTKIHVMEDGAFMMDVYSCSKSLSIIPQYNYYYRLREKSLIHSVTKPQYIQMSTLHWLNFLKKLSKSQLNILINNNKGFVYMFWRTSLMYKYMDCALTHSIFTTKHYKQITKSVSDIDNNLISKIEYKDKTDRILLGCIKNKKYFVFGIITKCKYLILNSPFIYNNLKRIMNK